MRRILSIVTLITLFALMITACAGEQAAQGVTEEEPAGGIYGGGEEVAVAEEPTETPTEVPTKTPAEVTPTEAPSEAPATEEVNTVQVGLTEYTIEMPTTLPVGPTTFEIENVGSFRHNFEIEGQGLEEVLATDLRADQSDTLDVDLEPGTYQVICPVSDHAEEGMRLELTVSQSSAEGPAEKMDLVSATERMLDAYGRR